MNAGLHADWPALTHRLVAENYAVSGSSLAIGGLSVQALVEEFGSPLYVYDAAILRQRFERLREAVKGFAEVYYSIKANPNPAVAHTFVQLGGGLEIASGAEFHLARAAGCRPSRILFAGPSKSETELRLTMEAGVAEIHLESFDEIERVAAIARALARPQAVSIRVNPGAAAQGGAMRMGGKPTAFGFDEEMLDAVVDQVGRHPELKLGGLHLFAGTQILDAAVLVQQWRYGLDLARQLADRIAAPLTSIDLGGGLGIPYHAGDAELDLAVVQAGAQALAAEVKADPRLANAAILIEPGRYLTGPAGLYLMRVNTVKHSRGQRFIVTDGGMHHHLAASGNLGQVIKRDYPVLAATRLGSPLAGNVAVVGPLCTPLDTLSRQTPMPEVATGDVIAILQSGAYGLSSSPVGFLSHPMPAEVMVDHGKAQCIRPRGSYGAPLVNLGAEPR
jgi:diaminopimelate decarboxylase